MSRLDQLISQYCPAGVPMVRLGEVCTFRRGSTITAKDAVDGGVPVIGGGQKPSYYHNIANRTAGAITVAGSGAYAGFVSFWDYPIWVSDAFTVEPKDGLLTKYVYLYLKINQKKIFAEQKGAGVPHVHGKDIADYLIPLPPLPVQEEIVRILDAMSDLVTNLDAEISARQKQYEHAREKLLTFGEEVEKKTLGEVGIFYGGLSGKSKEDFENGTARYISYKNVFLNAAADLGASDFVCVLPNEHQNAVEYGDILFTGSSETPDECGFSSVINKHPKESIYLNSFCFGLRLNNCSLLYPDFSKHLFRSSNIRMKIGKTANGVTRYNVSKKLFANISIPLPSLSVQQSIVERLDKMESLIQNLQAERDLRQKQYEYYREKLLTFE